MQNWFFIIRRTINPILFKYFEDQTSIVVLHDLNSLMKILLFTNTCQFIKQTFFYVSQYKIDLLVW